MKYINPFPAIAISVVFLLVAVFCGLMAMKGGRRG
jgi:hypothetical protein